MAGSKSNLIAYVCFLKIVACGVFLNGFFPFRPQSRACSSMEDLPSSVGNNRLDVQQLYRRHYSKVILMIIDALRFDFATDEHRMPFLNDFLKSNMSSCFLVTRTEVPTVTLPRIKAIVTGTIPGFLDVIFNFGSSEMTEDNIITQGFKQNYRVIFYGDDTWLRLYPSIFKRSEGTSSFFVNDFHEVDFNVTRNMRKELFRSDWDLMILHYLGLDHIGHVEGPFGKSISPKLKEMDDIVREIAQYLETLKNEGNDEGLLILTGDHGMKDSGGHGGASFEEVTVPLVLLNSRCHPEPQVDSFHQGDLAPLLATLWGVPIPASSTGRISPKWLSGLHPNESLYASYYNALRMKNSLNPSSNNEIQDEFNKGISHYDSWIKNNNTDDWELAATHFVTVQEKVSLIMAKSNETNMFCLFSAILLLFQGLCLLFTEPDPSWFSIKVFLLPFLVIVYVLMGIDSTLSPTFLGGVFALGLSVYNMLLLISSKFSFKAVEKIDYFFVTMIALHPLSYLGTSFIEEEHQYWYFIFATLLGYVVYREASLRKVLIPLLFMQRFLKNINQTGDKWASIPDFGDWLRLPENSSSLSCFYFIGLLASGFANWKKCGPDVNSFADLVGIFLQCLLTCMYNMAIGNISIPYYHHNTKSSGILEVKIFWIITTLRTTIAVYRFSQIEVNYRKLDSPRIIIRILTQLHLSIVTLLVKPHNILFAPSLLLFSFIFGSNNKQLWKLGVFHYALGMVFFFYMRLLLSHFHGLQGNSNSIASIDVSVGFVGLENFNIVLAGLYIILHTYAFPILAYLLLLEKLLNMKTSEAGYELQHDLSVTYILLNGTSLLIFMVLIVIQRHHLFIWSVFSPKLLYLTCHTVLIVVLVIPSCYIFRSS